MGAERQVYARLVEPVAPPPLPPAADSLLPEAQSQRADVNAAESQQRAAQQIAAAERKLRYPTLDVLGSAGQIPFHDRTLQGDYAAARFN